MKFYKYKHFENYLNIIFYYKLNAIYSYQSGTLAFYKNGQLHNAKNAAYIAFNGYKQFILNDKYYDSKNKFTKESWRRFVKMQIFI